MTVEDFRTSLAEGIFILDCENPDDAKATIVTSSSNILELPQGFLDMVRHALACRYLRDQKVPHLIDTMTAAESVKFVEMMPDKDVIECSRNIFRAYHDCNDGDLEVFLKEV